MFFSLFQHKIYVYGTEQKKIVRVKLSRFRPVTMYHCGPTVYDEAHIGNLRSYVFADILRRTLEWNGYRTRQVINITDVGHLVADGDYGEDKMTKALVREKLPMTLESMYLVGTKYMNLFKDDLEALNIIPPHEMPRASESVDEDVALIEKLEKRGFAYVLDDGVYFDTKKFTGYGRLGVQDIDDTKDRVVNNEKKNHRDFALWKFDKKIGWKSPWGLGFPGWHIECTAMIYRFLGKTVDFHTGGIDHIPIHHNNEIAEAEAATGRRLARYWIHNAFVTIEDGKMAKSAQNFVTRRGLEKEGIRPLAYRYWLLTARYRTQVNVGWDILASANDTYGRLLDSVANLPAPTSPDLEILRKFREFVNNDLDTPKAIALMWVTLKDSNLDSAVVHATLLEMDKVLGLDLDHAKNILDKEKENIPSHVLELAEKRELARKNKDWKHADVIRIQISEQGFEVEDSTSGPIVKKK